MFKNFFGGKSEPPDKPTGGGIDRSLGFEKMPALINHLQKGNFRQFENEYEQLAWDARSLVVEGVGLNPENAPTVIKWVKNAKRSYIAQLFAGVLQTGLAWQARTAALGKDVDAKRAEAFFEHLEAAYEHLNEADAINPDDAEICARMIRVCMGQGVEEHVTTSYFDAAKKLVPGHLPAHLMMANYLTPKWRGSVEKLHAFANEHYKSANSLLVTLKLFAFTEEWLYLGLMGDKDAKQAYFGNKILGQEVLTLHGGYTEEEEGRLLVPFVRNYFAFVLYKIGEKDLARQEIKKIPGKMTEYPWAYIGISDNKQLQAL